MAGERETDVKVRPTERTGAVWLTILSDAGTHTQRLPTRGRLIIGRASDCNIVINDSSLSRTHAALLIVGDELLLEDLGSRNGTRVGERVVEQGDRIAVEPGVGISLGHATLILHNTPPGDRQRRILSHGQLELYVESECTRAEEGGAPFAIARLELDSKERAPENIARLEQLFADSLRPRDLLATYSPGVYEVIFLGSDRVGSSALLAELDKQIGVLRLPVTSVLASYPGDGRSAGELIDALSRLAQQGLPTTDDAIVRTTLGAPTPLVRRVAGSDINVLVFGETGVGKEVMARAIVDLSPRAKRPLVSLNCAAFAESLLDSELFGYEKGAFTGASQDKAGLLESADGGTVFLDEIGEMPASVQTKLLRVIELKQVQRLGALRPKQIDVRFLAATHRDLEAEIAAGRFREDLYFRLNGMSLMVLPLRERPEEIDALAELFLERAAERMNVQPRPLLSREAREVLRAYRWPGNVRELRNIVERAVVLSTSGVITPQELPLDKMTMKTVASQPMGQRLAPADLDRRAIAARAMRADEERQRIVAALDETEGNQTEAARLLGISRRTLVSRIDEFGLPRPRKR